MVIKTKIGQVLKDEGRTGKWLASKVGKTPNTISLWVNGKVNMTLEDIYAVCNVLDIEVSDLLFSKKEMNKIKSDNN